jgi:hypothetical protein
MQIPDLTWLLNEPQYSLWLTIPVLIIVFFIIRDAPATILEFFLYFVTLSVAKAVPPASWPLLSCTLVVIVSLWPLPLIYRICRSAERDGYWTDRAPPTILFPVLVLLLLVPAWRRRIRRLLPGRQHS